MKLPEEADNLIYWTTATQVHDPSSDKDYLLAANSVGSIFGLYNKGPESFEKEKVFSFADQSAVVTMACDRSRGIVAAGNATGFVIFLQSSGGKKVEPIGSL